MNRRHSLLALTWFCLLPAAVRAQPAAKPPTVGVVWTSPLPAVQSLQEHMLRGLRELGHVPGKTVIVEFRSAEGKPARLPALVGDLVRRNVDVIVAPSNAVAKLARDLTGTIPIVMVDVSNPLGLGLIASLERPGGNVTGTYTVEAALNAKRLALLKQIVPGLERAAVFMTRGNALEATHRRDVETVQSTMAVKVELVQLDGIAELDRAMAAAAKRGVRAVLLLPAGGEPALFAQRRKLVQAAAKHGMPAAGGRNTASDGVVISYGSRTSDHYYRSAAFIDRILKGAKPAELPVEQPASFGLVVNLKAAQALGLTVPPSLLRSADRVLE